MPPKLTEELRNVIVALSRAGRSRRWIARELSVSRNTVRAVLEAVERQRAQGHSALPAPPQRRGSILDEHHEFIAETLRAFPDITAVRLHEELVSQGFKGGYTIVLQRLNAVRPQPKQPPVERFETAPGVQGQQDWSPYTLPFTETGEQTVKAFSFVLGYSRRQHLHFVEAEGLLPLIRGLRRAFEDFEGVPTQILFDSQKAVVLRWEANIPLYNPRFLAFATHYEFRPVAYRRNPQIKGKVERPFQYIEGNLLNGRSFRDLGHLNEVALWWRANRADVRQHGTVKERPIDRFAVEAPHLQPLPARPYDTARVAYRVISIEGLVEVDTVRYSVPYEHVLELAVVRVTEDELFVYGPQLRLIARHGLAARGRVEPVIDSAHRPKKRRQRHDVELLTARLAALDEIGAEFAAGVVRRQRYRGKHLSGVLALIERYDADDLVEALRRAVHYRAYDARVVGRILEAHAQPRILPDAGQQAAIERLRNVIDAPAPRSMDVYASALRDER